MPNLTTSNNSFATWLVEQEMRRGANPEKPKRAAPPREAAWLLEATRGAAVVRKGGDLATSEPRAK